MPRWIAAALRMLFVVAIAYPVVLLWLGLHVRHRQRLPLGGPAIVVANHNSHLDMLALLSLFPLVKIPDIRPAAAADYFFRNAWISWLSVHLIGLIPVVRGGGSHDDPLAHCYRVLEAGKILIIFPEGTRGEPERMAELKSGVWYLARRFPQIPVIPVFLHGLGKAMPKGTLIPVPFFVSVGIGRALYGDVDKARFMAALRERFGLLKLEISPHHESENR